MRADVRQTAIKLGKRIVKWSRRHAKETEGVGRGRGHGCVHHLELLHTFAFCPARALAGVTTPISHGPSSPAIHPRRWRLANNKQDL
jgi:hypothetical protein